ncbi:hypothetical protein ISCGN_024057 [Ixodes scapularis]
MAASSSKPNTVRPPKRGCSVLTFEKASEPPKFPRFFVLQALDEEKPLAKLSPFLVSKCLDAIIGKAFKAKKLSGHLLVEVETEVQSRTLLKQTCLGEHKIKVSPHRTLNSVRGVISEADLIDCSEDEILAGLQKQAVVAVKRITIRKDGQEQPTKQLILTLELHTLPTTVKAGYLYCKVRPFIPNPQRCFRCQRFGHGSRNCRGRETCAKCGSNDHVADICENTLKCVNCQGNHAAYARTCPQWKQEKEILTLKAQKNITYQEAKQQYSFLAKGTFAQAVLRGPAPRTESKATQVSPEVLAVALQSPTPQQRQQLPPVSGGSAPAASRPRDRQGTPLSVPTPRAPAREKERESRPNSRERTSSKERHRAAPSTAEGQGQMELGDAQPSTSTTAPLSEGGRGRGVRPRASTLPRPIQQASSQEVEAKDEATELSALSSDQDDMEWETTKSKKKTEKPVIPPK